MPKPRTFLLLILFLLSFGWLSFSGIWKTKPVAVSLPEAFHKQTIHSAERLKEKADSAKNYIRQKGFNTNFCFLIDMSLPSGQNRFFVYDLKKDSVIQKGSVAHGNCYGLPGGTYSNKVGSGCTSLGRYKVGYSYNGVFGLAYKLYGLDATNSKAFERFVVLHSHSCVPDIEIPDEICQSNGCPTVSPVFLQKLKTSITASRKPVLLWIYE